MISFINGIEVTVTCDYNERAKVAVDDMDIDVIVVGEIVQDVIVYPDVYGILVVRVMGGGGGARLR